MAKQKIDSNIVGLSFAEEVSLKQLPTPESDTVWYPLEPNEYNDFGGEISTIAREPINASRQNKKGVVTDVEASGGFEQDLTQRGLQRLLQGFFFADAHERARTAPLSGAPSATIALDNLVDGNTLTLATGDGAKFVEGMILKSSGMKVSANNKNRIIVVSIAGDVLTTNQTFVAETVDANSTLEVVGYQFDTGVLSVSYVGGTAKLILTDGSFLGMGLNIGEWIFIGGDDPASQFTTNPPGYARIIGITAGELTIDQLSFTPATEAGTGKAIELYTGMFIRNEKDLDKIKTRSYQLERTLGQDENGFQSEYLVGAIANEFNISISSADKITSELSFIALDNELRSGAEGLKAGTRMELLPEDAYNTSSDIYQMRLYVHDPSKPTPDSLFAVVLEASLSINNNVSGLKGIGIVGSFDINVGNFVVGGELEVYFATVAAVKAVKNNADVGFNLIAAKNNEGFVYDIPLLSLGGGRVNVSKDEPIMLPLEKQAAECQYGYTLSATYFSYLPNVAMATQ